jgi:fucose 4-O-acetylase-like acetyltransferase
MLQNQTEKNRFIWIDTAKGIGILLVIINHLSLYLNISKTNPYITVFDDILGSIDMPLFFLISGLLYKRQQTSFSLIRKKAKRLIIPFLFFYSIFSVIIPSLYLLTDTHCPLIINHGITIRMLIGDFFFNDCQIINGPLWFLLSLFGIQILFAFFSLFQHRIIIYVLSLLSGIGGLLLSYYSINLYASIDNALTCLPFFAFGFFLRNDTRFIDLINHTQKLPFYIITCAIICLLTKSHVEYHRNIIYNYSIFTAHICGISGALMILLLAQTTQQFSFINYLGRYSIIILCSHYLVIKLTASIFDIHHQYICFLVIFILVLCSQLIMIPICKRFLPFLLGTR